MSSDRWSGLAEGCEDWPDRGPSDEIESDSDNDLGRLPGFCHSNVIVGVCQINTSGDYRNG